ncbi:ditrans,polycis-polyprenyl diphosphate synthase SCDLUD_000276 [Saccharomycodes ludwigii]|uniref:ditrans,polycis-polyprenyl diphosphate synthase n=1 Tax=Saccharomycodes ludwigii TaxID=36035 RepID=UPI001E87F084|nr:hypothetical protein SCDLUD_000276 [Saccharomycodes ludwigii]KAH3902692.1 hypothetical protein SCDLUD_000276 [Saccharomycodes ludwigii]
MATLASSTSYHSKRISAPENERPNAAKLNLKKIKSLAETTILKPRQSSSPNRENEIRSVNKDHVNRISFIFYKVLLAIFFCVYACVRYYQYTWNRTKIKLFNLAYNPSNTPQLIRRDVIKLNKIPKRLATIIDYRLEEDVGGGINGLVNNATDIIAWTVSSGIKHLILYDYDGRLKSNVALLRDETWQKLCNYFGPKNPPKFAFRIPHSNKLYFNRTDNNDNNNKDDSRKVSIEVTLLSNEDGRETIVDLTKTMADLCSNKHLSLDDITMDLVDSELKLLVGHEPDLLIYFGPSLDLQGYPPWHIRLTELYWEPDNDEVTYSVFIRGLKKYSSCKINVGK